MFLLAFEHGDFIRDKIKRVANSFKNVEAFEIPLPTLKQEATAAAAAREN